MALLDHKNILASFKAIPLLFCLDDDDKQLLVKKCRLEAYDAGCNIVEQGDKTTNVYFIFVGAAHVLNYSRSGRAVTYAALKQGDVFGEIAAIDGLPRSAWVRTIMPCQVACLPGIVFLDLVLNNKGMSLALLRKLSSNLREADERLSDASWLGAEQRACIELIRMAKPDPLISGSYLVLEMPTQANFANVIGTSRETVSRVFGRLKEDAIITYSSRGICIPNRERLEQRAFM